MEADEGDRARVHVKISAGLTSSRRPRRGMARHEAARPTAYYSTADDRGKARVSARAPGHSASLPINPITQGGRGQDSVRGDLSRRTCTGAIDDQIELDGH